jgi:hypothetical protein
MKPSCDVGLYCAKTVSVVLRSPGYLSALHVILLSYGHIGLNVYSCAL